jgi:hypothetical protein
VNGRDFLEIAKMFRTSDNEAARRTSIGRSYYALFNAVRQTLELQQISFKGDASDHGTLTAALKKCGDRTAYKLGDTLSTLPQDRNGADYGMITMISAQKSKWAFQLTSDGFALLDQMNPVSLAARVRPLI